MNMISEKEMAINRQAARTADREREREREREHSAFRVGEMRKNVAVIQTAQKPIELRNMIKLNASQLLRTSAPAVTPVYE
jgi:hypothetical protein